MEIQISKNYNLAKLQKWLNYELSGTVLFVLSYIYIITQLLAIFLAIVFLPLLFKVLIQEKRYGWILFFFISVIGPGLISYFFFGQASWLYRSTNAMTAIIISLMFFYFYCATLRLVIPGWFYEEDEI